MRRLAGAGLALLFCLVCLAGCGGTDTVEVEGTVTYDGQPIKVGTIAFLPGGGDNILDGRYRVRSNAALKPGICRVEIRWARPTGKTMKSETGHVLEVTEEGLPPKYNDNTELTAELTLGKNTVNFDMKK